MRPEVYLWALLQGMCIPIAYLAGIEGIVGKYETPDTIIQYTSHIVMYIVKRIMYILAYNIHCIM